MTSPVVRCQGVSKRYGEVEALRDMSFEIEERELVAIVGPSGCGKTTLLRMIGNLEAVDRGELYIGTHNERTTAIGFVFQTPTLLPWRTVEDNVRLPLVVAGVDETEARVDEALRRVGLEEFGAAYPGELSVGMQHRAALARVLVQRAALWLMDEPFAALDEISRREMATLVRQLWEERHIPAFFVTHSVEEAVLVGERVLVLSPRPSRVIANVKVDLGNGRTLDLLDEDRFATLVRSVRQALRANQCDVRKLQ